MLLFFYLILTLVMGGAAIWKGAIYPGVAGILGPSLCWFAASGLKGSLMVGTPSQKVAGVGAAIVAVGVGFGVVYHSGYWVNLFNYEFAGSTWCIFGLVVGWVSTTQQHATR